MSKFVSPTLIRPRLNRGEKPNEADEIDAAVADELLAKSFVDSYADIMTIGQPLSAEVYAIAVCPSNTELLQTLNNGLNELRRQD